MEEGDDDVGLDSVVEGRSRRPRRLPRIEDVYAMGWSCKGANDETRDGPSAALGGRWELALVSPAN